MVKKIIKPITLDGKVTLPKVLREKYDMKDYIEIIDSGEGLTIKKLK